MCVITVQCCVVMSQLGLCSSRTHLRIHNQTRTAATLLSNVCCYAVSLYEQFWRSNAAEFIQDITLTKY